MFRHDIDGPTVLADQGAPSFAAFSLLAVESPSVYPYAFAIPGPRFNVGASLTRHAAETRDPIRCRCR